MISQARVSIEIDETSSIEWGSLIRTFSDATVFQTREYGESTWGGHNLSHLVLKLDGQTVAAAQVRTWTRVPGVKYAYVAYGPMWRTDAVQADCQVLNLMLKALVQEYVRRRGCSLRIFPFAHEADAVAGLMTDAFVDNGFTLLRKAARTLVLDISVPEKDLRDNLRRKWRHGLQHAEKAGLDVTCSRSGQLFAECLAVYREMHKRKQFRENVGMNDFLSLHERLPEAHKFRILTAGKNGEIQACVITSAIGDTAILLMAATAVSGLDTGASYLAYWETLKRLHSENIHWFDFRGIDAKSNPGGYVFKTGISGKKGLEVSYLGDFVFYHDDMARMLTTAAEKTRHLYHVVKAAL